MAISRRKRFKILERDGFKCGYCGRSAGEVVLEIDHIIAKSRGGSDDPRNLVAACFDCNRGKRDHGTRYYSQPAREHGTEWWTEWNDNPSGDEFPRTQPRRTAPIDWSIPRAPYAPMPVEEVMRLAEGFCGEEG